MPAFKIGLAGCCCGPPVLPDYNIYICMYSCATGAGGPNVTISVPYGTVFMVEDPSGSVVASGSAGSNGCGSVSGPFVVGVAYTVVVPGYPPPRYVSPTFTYRAGMTSLGFPLIAAGYVCTGVCGFPLSKRMVLTCRGAHTGLIWNGAGYVDSAGMQVISYTGSLGSFLYQGTPGTTACNAGGPVGTSFGPDCGMIEVTS